MSEDAGLTLIKPSPRGTGEGNRRRRRRSPGVDAGPRKTPERPDETAGPPAACRARRRPGPGRRRPCRRGPAAGGPQLDLDRYAGRWYEIAWLPMPYEDDCTGDVRAEYARRPDGGIEVINRCRTAAGESIARGSACACSAPAGCRCASHRTGSRGCPGSGPITRSSNSTAAVPLGAGRPAFAPLPVGAGAHAAARCRGHGRPARAGAGTRLRSDGVDPHAAGRRLKPPCPSVELDRDRFDAGFAEFVGDGLGLGGVLARPGGARG